MRFLRIPHSVELVVCIMTNTEKKCHSFDVNQIQVDRRLAVRFRLGPRPRWGPWFFK